VALSSAVIGDRWAEYAPAVHRWEDIFGRSAPEPTEPTSRGGGQRLAPQLPEWMMGLDRGYLTDHLERVPALRLAGNGVMPQQAAHAVRDLWPHA
jgi:DNA (cytosine-5)-methyltransferase 1